MSNPIKSSATARAANPGASAKATKASKPSTSTERSALTYDDQLQLNYDTYRRIARTTFALFVLAVVILALAACVVALTALFQSDPSARPRAVTYLVILLAILAAVLAAIYLVAQHLISRCLCTLSRAISLYRRAASDAATARRSLDRGCTTSPILDCSLENWRLLSDDTREHFLMRLYNLERDDLRQLLNRGGWQISTMSEQDCLKLGHYLWDY